MTRVNGHGPQPGPRHTQRVQGPPPQGAPQRPVQPSQPVVPGLPELLAELRQQTSRNERDLADLQQRGAQVNPLSMVTVRIDMLIDSVARFAGQDGPRWAALTRLEFAQAVAREIAEAGGQATQAQLSMGSRLSPAEIAHLARESGMFGTRGGW